MGAAISNSKSPPPQSGEKWAQDNCLTMSDGGQACFFILWVIIVASTFLSTACTWGFSQKYDESENAAYSGVAALLSSIALCGCTLGLCGWPLGHGGSETKMCMGILWQCFNSFDGDNEISMCIKLLAGCGLGIVIIPSFGILQVS